MSDNSKIEWTDASWNCIRARNLKTGKVGWHCEHVTPGCEHCYAEGFNMRLGTGLPFKPGHRRDIEIFLDDNMLQLPLRWKKSRKIFVGSMTDLFADFVTDEMLDRVFAVMALSAQHTFQVLTKRADRMRDYCAHHAGVWCPQLGRRKPLLSNELIVDLRDGREGPLPNVWLGVSCENQEQADARIPLLLQTPAAVRFVSAEPLLGAIDLDRIHEWFETPEGARVDVWESALNGKRYDIWAGDDEDPMQPGHPKLDWLIAGGESGPKARPMHPDWARGLRDQCAAAGVAYHFKQWGEFAPEQMLPIASGARDIADGTVVGESDSVLRNVAYAGHGRSVTLLRRVGKKAAGRLLDGVEHNAFPTGSAA